MDEQSEAPQPLDWSAHTHDARVHETDLVWNYATKGWFRRAETSILYGPSNCGKSAIVCHLGVCISTGQPFFGTRVRQGIVVHVGAEAPVSILDRLSPYDLRSSNGSPYLVVDRAVDLSNRAEVASFIDHLGWVEQEYRAPIQMVVFDTLARSIGDLDENSSSAMTEVASAAERIARSLDAHVMLVHHTGKDADRGGRGSSALRGAVDTEVCLKRHDDKHVIVSQEKQRTMEKLGPVYFRTEAVRLGVDEDGDDRTTVKAVEVEKIDAPDVRKPGRAMRVETHRTAVLTSLTIRGMAGETAKPFRAADILATLPSEIFGDIKMDSRVRSVTRILENLAAQPDAIVTAVTGGWRLQPTSESGVSDAMP